MEQVEGQVGFDDARLGHAVQVVQVAQLVAVHEVQRPFHHRLQDRRQVQITHGVQDRRHQRRHADLPDHPQPQQQQPQQQQQQQQQQQDEQQRCHDDRFFFILRTLITY